MKEVWSLTCDTPGQKLLLLAIADSERDETGSWYSLSKLQKRCSMSRQGILNQIAVLEKRGWISVSRGERSSTVYRLTLPVHAMDYLPDKKHAFKPVHSVDQSIQLTSPQNGLRVVNGVDCCQSTQWTEPVHAMDSIPKEPKVETKDEPNHYGEGFEEFWKAYPKKKSKGDAEKAWKKNRCKSVLPKILCSIRLAKSSIQWTKEMGQFIPHPASWLNSHGWEDESDTSHKEEEIWVAQKPYDMMAALRASKAERDSEREQMEGERWISE